MRHRLAPLIAALAALLVLPAAAHAVTRYVNQVDPTCGGQSPCHGTIQVEVTAAQAGDTSGPTWRQWGA